MTGKTTMPKLINLPTSYTPVKVLSSAEILYFTSQFWCLQDNLPTNQLAVSQVADWITRGLVNSPTTNLKKSWNYNTLFVH